MQYSLIMSDIMDAYQSLLDFGIKKEDARFIVPNACKTTILMTMNARAFIEQCSRRLCHRAQWEIQELYKNMKECIKDIYPHVYKLAVPPCVSSKCNEVHPCGNPYVNNNIN